MTSKSPQAQDSHTAQCAGMNEPAGFLSDASLRVPDPLTQFNFSDDLDFLWNGIDIGALSTPSGQSDTRFGRDMIYLSQHGMIDPSVLFLPDLPPALGSSENHGQNTVECGMLSSYSSRLPSLEPSVDEAHSTSRNISRDTPRSIRNYKSSCPWRITQANYITIVALIHEVQPSLPVGFELPSRHSLCRYFEGYFTDFHRHLPFLHIPTITITNIPLALWLAIAAIGAQYRFERQEALNLYRASKALIDHQIETRYHCSSAFTPLHSSSQDNLSQDPATQYENSRDEGPENQVTELTQALVLLMIFATYNHHSLLQDAFAISNCLVHYLRESKLLENDGEPSNQTWEQWVKLEGRRRTILGAFVFIHIQSVVYDIPPKLMSSEIRNIRVPSSEAQWNALDATMWRAIKENSPLGATFGEIHAAHFGITQQCSTTCNISSFANLALIHALIQNVHLAWELNSTVLNDDSCNVVNNQSLPSSTVSRLECALGQWKSNWEATEESSINPISSSGPLGFNCTALFRIACIRLYYNIGPYLQFKTRDPRIIAEKIRKAPLPSRTPKLYSAVLQSAHSLSIPVRLGVEYVARTQTLTWSIVHTLCNVECALFLTKWLELMVVDTESICAEEQRLLDIVNSVLSETDFKISIKSERDRSKQIKRVGIGIVKLLAQTLRGSHVFELVEVLKVSLEMYASVLENDL
ncbi:hypothetical protein BGW36DRAFT_405285 [Talaromyces proteolyticus]|uniref:Xylanolytic transcriptional activator regulatory domain-containing protein n=1 Tax=Talaromyces proteolyticus TaxID=1131652 RepID=A0AAD4PZE3_9EURO|nr:uncharacterized protein BGW36DRAFT_405285 [Talaromyces proteolyticus]KAH8702515.1 hypothetical protein BGW36DRAFT_405285 [Talaromyces proteolyticus]